MNFSVDFVFLYYSCIIASLVLIFCFIFSVISSRDRETELDNLGKGLEGEILSKYIV